MRLSARNQLKGTIVEIQEGAVNGIVKLDIDLLMIDDQVLKPKDMEREFVKQGMEELIS